MIQIIVKSIGVAYHKIKAVEEKRLVRIAD